MFKEQYELWANAHLCYPAYMLNVYINQPSWQTGSRNLMGPKTLTTIWGTYMKLVTKYQVPVINSCWEKCDEKCEYMLNVYKSQLSRQTGSRNLTGQKMLPTPVCRLCWFLYTLNIYAHFSQQKLMAEIWYFVTSFI
jgi:hypothetical protein